MIDLDELGKAITGTDAEAGERVRLRLLDRPASAGVGRLADLAQWWASVRNDDRAAAPQRLRHVGLELPLPVDGTAQEALAWGVAAADDAADSGVDLLVLTVNDPLAARLVAAELMGLDPVEASGWPQDRGQDDDSWMDEVVVLRDGLNRTRGLRGELGALLDAVGSAPMAAASALAVQATVRRTPMLLDGPGAAAAALLARRTAYTANQWWQAAHGEADGLHGRTLRSLALDPITSLGVVVEDGTAARLGLGVLTVAAELLTR